MRSSVTAERRSSPLPKAHETLRIAAEEAGDASKRAREVLTELTDLARRMRVATEAQEAIVEANKRRGS